MSEEVDEGVEQYLEDTTETPLHEEFTADELIGYYIGIRDRKKEIEEQHKEELKPLNDGLADIEYALSILLDEQGTTSMKGSSGSANYRTYASVKVADRFALDDWVKRTGNTEIYESRVSMTAFQELGLEADPPGTERSEYKRVIVSAPRKR